MTERLKWKQGRLPDVRFEDLTLLELEAIQQALNDASNVFTNCQHHHGIKTGGEGERVAQRIFEIVWHSQ